MKGSVAKAEELGKEIPGAVMVRQFENPAGPKIHRETTAEEIWRDLDGNIDVFIAGSGTCGTITGTGQRLKELNPNINLDIFCNVRNLGHGPSTIKGMFRAVELNPDLVVTIDGDGQFIENEILEAINDFIGSECDILEGNRVARQEPVFRRASTCKIMHIKCIMRIIQNP
jgi:glycosyltransferase involved in cell wall biosynthesis